jgi:hypothetical protein
MAHVVGPGKVVSIDVDREVLSEAWDHLRSFPERRVTLKHADGRAGCPDEAPFDRIVVTAASPDLEPAWLEQSSAGGLILAPCTFAPSLAYVLRGCVRAGEFHGEPVRAAFFMPLRAEAESGPPAEFEPTTDSEFETILPPWEGWFDGRRPRLTWLGFIHSLAFLGLMQGLGIHSAQPQGKDVAFGVSDGGAVCWFEPGQWRVTGEAGHKLGLSLWRSFLEFGGPRPAEYRLRAAPSLQVDPAAAPTFIRNGVRCIQHWTIRAGRDRGRWL